jgi:hypothetical protein
VVPEAGMFMVFVFHLFIRVPKSMFWPFVLTIKLVLYGIYNTNTYPGGASPPPWTIPPPTDIDFSGLSRRYIIHLCTLNRRLYNPEIAKGDFLDIKGDLSVSK